MSAAALCCPVVLGLVLVLIGAILLAKGDSNAGKVDQYVNAIHVSPFGHLSRFHGAQRGYSLQDYNVGGRQAFADAGFRVAIELVSVRARIVSNAFG